MILLKPAGGIDFIFVAAAFPPITAAVLENIPSVRMIQSAGTGYDKVDTESAARCNIPVANSPGVNITTVAEFTVAMIITLQRRMLIVDHEIKAGNYNLIREKLFTGGLKEISDLHLGVGGIRGHRQKGRPIRRAVGCLGKLF
jgi:lactate dehydrogenase-like 2-hydroxyacid dehydrogenase